MEVPYSDNDLIIYETYMINNICRMALEMNHECKDHCCIMYLTKFLLDKDAYFHGYPKLCIEFIRCFCSIHKCKGLNIRDYCG